MSLNKRLISTGVTPIVVSEHFQMVTWSGNSTSGRSITGVGFQPDIVLIKTTSAAGDWVLKMSKDFPSTEWQEWNQGKIENRTTSTWIQSLDSDGFTVGNDNEVNGIYDYIAYCWKINGNSANPDVNPITKMSQRSYTGNGSIRNLSHGMGTSDVTFCIISTGLSSGSGQTQYKVGKHTDQPATQFSHWAIADEAQDNNGPWNDTAPTSTNFTVRSTYSNYSGQDYVFWGMTNIDGFSKFGSYTGNGSTSGPTITTDFQPGFIWIRRSELGDINRHIYVYDIVNSGGTGTTNDYMRLTDNNGVFTGTSNSFDIDITTTGFQLKNNYSDLNESGKNYFYWVWADPTI